MSTLTLISAKLNQAHSAHGKNEQILRYSETIGLLVSDMLNIKASNVVPFVRRGAKLGQVGQNQDNALDEVELARRELLSYKEKKEEKYKTIYKREKAANDSGGSVSTGLIGAGLGGVLGGAAAGVGGRLLGVVGKLLMRGGPVVAAAAGGWSLGTELNDLLNEEIKQVSGGEYSSLGDAVYEFIHGELGTNLTKKVTSTLDSLIDSAKRQMGEMFQIKGAVTPDDTETTSYSRVPTPVVSTTDRIGGLGSMTSGAADSEIGKLIAKTESKPGLAGYEVMVDNREPPKPLTQMTIREVTDYQKTLGARNAAGKWQIQRPTLLENYKQAGLTLDSKFDKSAQDKLFDVLLDRRGAWSAFKRGEISSSEMLTDASKTWAGLPTDASGKSYWEGTGGNQAGVSYSEAKGALEASRSGTILDEVDGSTMSQAPSTVDATGTEVKSITPIQAVPEVTPGVDQIKVNQAPATSAPTNYGNALENAAKQPIQRGESGPNVNVPWFQSSSSDRVVYPAAARSQESSIANLFYSEARRTIA